MSRDSTQFATLKGLNQVYSDIRHRISNIGTIFHVKGSKKWSQLMALTSASNNDVYNIIVPPDGSDPPADTRIQDGTNVMCIKSFSGGPINPAEWATYWDIAGGLIEVATEDTAGVIRLGATVTSAEDVDDASLVEAHRGVILDENDHAYVPIPVANGNSATDQYTYGLVSTGNQVMKGAKTLNGDFTVAGNIEYSNTAQGTINHLQVNELEVGSITITENNGVISFTV